MKPGAPPRRRWPRAAALPCALAALALLAPRALRAQAARPDPEPGGEDLSGVPVQEARIEGERARQPAAAPLRGNEAAALPGAHGDAALAAQMLPGVAREPAGSGELVVWGAAPRETRLLIDGIEVPALYHAGGFRSVIPTEAVQRLALSPAAFGPELGGALGGVLEVEAKAPAAPRPQARLAADPLDVHGAVETPLLFAGARVSLVDRWLGPALSDTARQLFPLPAYWDAQLLAGAPLREGERLELILLAASDQARRTVDPGDPAIARGDASTSRWLRAGLRWRRALAGGAEATALAWGGAGYRSSLDFAGASASALSDWSRVGGLRAGLRAPLSPGVELRLGADAQLARTRLVRTGTLTTPHREGDVTAFGEFPGGDAAFDDWSAVQGEVALHAAAALALGPLSLTPGLRLAAAISDLGRVTPPAPGNPGVGASELAWLAEPRLSLELRAGEELRFFAAAGLHHQAPDPADLSAVFGDPTLGVASALHATAGASLRPIAPLRIEAAGFFRSLWDLASRSPLPTPRLAQALVEEGGGRAFGAQLSARLARGPLTAFLWLLASRSERTDHPGAAARLSDYDQPLAATAAVSWAQAGWTAGARLRASSGYPRTPVIGAYLDATAGRSDPVFGAQNGDRLPAFVQLDLRLERTFPLGAGRSLKLSLEVQNATARSNAEEFAYSADWSRRGQITGLPAFALLGAEVVL